MRKTMLAGAVIATIFMTSLGQSQAASPPNMLVIGTDVEPPDARPGRAQRAHVSEVISNFYDNLVQLAPDDMQTIRPMLAESWEVSPDKRTITLDMRKDATFASGNPVTAEDAAWSIQRVIKLAQVGATDIALWGFTPENVDKLVRATDAKTLVIEIPEPVSTDLVLYSLAGSSLGHHRQEGRAREPEGRTISPATG